MDDKVEHTQISVKDINQSLKNTFLCENNSPESTSNDKFSGEATHHTSRTNLVKLSLHGLHRSNILLDENELEDIPQHLVAKLPSDKLVKVFYMKN